MKLKHGLITMIAGEALAHSTAMTGQVSINFSDARFFQRHANADHVSFERVRNRTV
ncbi:hypothetical protein [Massilia eurypsychrophila]|jgi:hypothetical protein|uniref:hypothetical protein n=1 Tax=Massilia eurypsychrophila TaxID=1485217 RepID=UPI0015D4F447|nr:hypothetical protein [Massilia eurypsychrophila]